MKAKVTRHTLEQLYNLVMGHTTELKTESILEVHMSATLKELEEFEKHAELGLATEKVFEKEVFENLAISGDSFKSAESLLNWYKSEVKR